MTPPVIQRFLKYKAIFSCIGSFSTIKSFMFQRSCLCLRSLLKFFPPARVADSEAVVAQPGNVDVKKKTLSFSSQWRHKRSTRRHHDKKRQPHRPLAARQQGFHFRPGLFNAAFGYATLVALVVYVAWSEPFFFQPRHTSCPDFKLVQWEVPECPHNMVFHP